MTKFWYKFKNRGLSLGCQPKDFVDTDNGAFAGKFGAVAYERELIAEEVNEYELELWYMDTPVCVKVEDINKDKEMLLDFLEKAETAARLLRQDFGKDDIEDTIDGIGGTILVLEAAERLAKSIKKKMEE